MTLRIVRRATSPSALAPSGRLHPVLERVYAARGVRSAAELDTSLERLLPVGTLEGIPEAVELLLAHRTRRVLVVGDFDADGATSCALVVRALRGCGFAAVFASSVLAGTIASISGSAIDTPAAFKNVRR